MLTNDAPQLRLTPAQAANILSAFEKTRRQGQAATPVGVDDDDEKQPAASAATGSDLQCMEQLNARRTPEPAASGQFDLPDAPCTPDGSGAPTPAGGTEAGSAATPPNATVFAEVCADAMGLPAFRQLLAASRAETLDLLAHAYNRDEIPDAQPCALFDTVEAQLTAGSPHRKPVVEQVMRHFLMEATLHGYSGAERQAIANEVSAIHQRWTRTGDAAGYLADHRGLVNRLRQALPALEHLQKIAARSEFCRLARQLPMLQRLELLKFAFQQVIPAALGPACRELEEEMGQVAGADDGTGRAAVSDALWNDFFAFLSEASRLEVGGMMQGFQQQLATDGDHAAYAARVGSLIARMAEGVRQEQRSVGPHDLLKAEELQTLRGRIAALPEVQPAQVVRLLMEAIDRRVQARIDDGDFGPQASPSAADALRFQILKSNRAFFSAQAAQILHRLAGPQQDGDPELAGRLAGSQALLDSLLAAMTEPRERRLGHDALRQCACDQPQTLEECRQILRSSGAWLITKVVSPGVPEGFTHSEKLLANLELQTCGLLLTDASREAMHAAFREVTEEFRLRQKQASTHKEMYRLALAKRPAEIPANADAATAEAFRATVASRPPLALPRYEKQAVRLDNICPAILTIPDYWAQLGGLTAIMDAEIAHRNAGLPFDPLDAVRASTHPDVIAARDALLTTFRFWQQG